jgi:phosphoglycolate phosphatase-like HAD superfamily hydrolase
MNLFIWDFHGVLEKYHEQSVVEVTNKVLEEFGFSSRLDIDLCIKLYGKRWAEYFKILCPGADEETIKAMIKKGIEISNQGSFSFRHIKPNDYSHEVLTAIKKAGHENLILSNTHPEVLGRFLDSINITEFIDHKIGADSHRKDMHSKMNMKIPLIKEFLNSRKYDKIIAIGDTEDDIDLGKAVGAITYLFSKRGFSKETNADYKISDLREILKEI